MISKGSVVVMLVLEMNISFSILGINYSYKYIETENSHLKL